MLTKHIEIYYLDNETDKNPKFAKIAQVQKEKILGRKTNIEIYNLGIVLAVG